MWPGSHCSFRILSIKGSPMLFSQLLHDWFMEDQLTLMLSASSVSLTACGAHDLKVVDWWCTVIFYFENADELKLAMKKAPTSMKFDMNLLLWTLIPHHYGYKNTWSFHSIDRRGYCMQISWEGKEGFSVR